MFFPVIFIFICSSIISIAIVRHLFKNDIWQSIFLAVSYLTICEFFILIIITLSKFHAEAAVYAERCIFFMPLTFASACMIMSSIIKRRKPALILSSIGYIVTIAFIIIFPRYGESAGVFLFSGMPLIIQLICLSCRINLLKATYIIGLTGFIVAILSDSIYTNNDSYMYLIFMINISAPILTAVLAKCFKTL